MSEKLQKTLGQAIDQLVEALKDLNESSRPIAIMAVCEHLEIPILKTGIAATHEDRQEGIATPIIEDKLKHSVNEIIDIRSLKEKKNPSNAKEMACLVALYLSEYAASDEQKKEIGERDIEKYFKQASYPLPKVPGQALRDAKSAGYLDSSSRGKFKLNPVGYNLAVHSLPRVKK